MLFRMFCHLVLVIIIKLLFDKLFVVIIFSILWILQQYSLKRIPCPSIEFHNEIEDILVVASNCEPKQPFVKANYPNVIVGLQCAVAVMRGSQVYAPGVTAIPSGKFYIKNVVSNATIIIPIPEQRQILEIRFLCLLILWVSVKEDGTKSIKGQNILLGMESWFKTEKICLKLQYQGKYFFKNLPF